MLIVVFIETKRENVAIEEAINQLKSYMNVCKVNYGIATNGKNIVFLNQQLERVNDIPVCNASILPSSVETYKYIDRITYRQTVFERDLSAKEVYVAEVRQKPEELKSLKVYSDIAAGIPIEIVDEVRGNFDVPREVLRGKENVYVLRVKGDSVLLLSANPKYEPIQIAEGDFSMMGKLVGVIRAL